MTTIRLQRSALGEYVATNEAGGQVRIGGEVEFSAVELLLAALAACTAIDVDHVTSRRAQPEQFAVEVSARKERTEQGNRLLDVVVGFEVRFPQGPEGDAARTVLPRIAAESHDRLCTVGRSLELPTPVRVELR
ncbi:MAG: OsmC family protein [Candidatus Nanopelagicales bacterium]